MIYLDNSATTKPSEAAVAAAEYVMREAFGNPSSLHTLGMQAEDALQRARRQAAAALSAREEEICFTSGGTEANNLALLGGAAARQKRGRRIVTTAIEHASIEDSARELEARGFEVVRVQPEADGTIDAEALRQAITPDTILVSVMMVNNETGALPPVEVVAPRIREVGAPALFHIDAVQALGKYKIDPAALGADLVTVSGHKIHALKGCGALYIRRGVTIRRRSFGGSQERSMRAGTEGVPAIAAFGAACAQLDPARARRAIEPVKEAFCRALLAIPGVACNSPENGAYHILNISAPGYRSETLLHALARREIYVSSGSACKKGEKSPVLTAQGLPPARIDGALRLSFCEDNTVEEAAPVAAALREILKTTAHR